MLIREAALDDGITKKLDELRWRQAAYAASRRRIEDAQMAIVENKRLGVSDPMLLGRLPRSPHLLEIGERMSLTSPSKHPPLSVETAF